MKRLAVALALAGASGAHAQDCEPPRGFVPQGRAESRDFVVLYRTEPAIAIGRHFAVDAYVCGKSAAAATGLRVDAQMPEHRHGMNYRAKVAAKGDGRYVAEGLMFHMPGRWQIVFDVDTRVDGKVRSERLIRDLVVE